MANFVYAYGMQKLLDGTWNGTSTLKAQLIRTVAGAGAGGNAVYTPTQATDQSRITGTVPNNAYCRVGSPVTLTTKTYTGGKLNCDPIDFGAIAMGDAIQGLQIFYDPGTGDSNCVLIAWDDTLSGSPGLPFTPNGSDVVYTPTTQAFAV